MHKTTYKTIPPNTQNVEKHTREKLNMVKAIEILLSFQEFYLAFISKKEHLKIKQSKKRSNKLYL